MASPATAVRNDPAAHDVLRGAHEGLYRYPVGFAGFAAAVVLEQDGTATRGTVTVRSPRDVTIEIAADETATGWIRQEVGSLAGHRWSSPYEAGDGRWALSLDPLDDHPLGPRVRIHGDPFDSSYRVHDGRIAQVDRRMGNVRFSITMQAHVAAVDGRALPAHFTVAYWDVGQDRLTRADTYSDRYAAVAGISLPAERRVVSADDAGVTVRRLLLTDHALLTSEAAAEPNVVVRSGPRAG